MDEKIFNNDHVEIAWCPGCGNFPILRTVKQALADLAIDPRQLVIVSGIGQAGKSSHYYHANAFNGLHGRALPPATAIKAVNPELTVIVESGDGDMYGEGGNHFMHCIRRNPDITVLVHDNMVYGLTKGQASPTAQPGFTSPTQPEGVISESFNPLAVAISLGASFVARANAADMPQTKEIIKKAIQHKGFALVDIFQPCVIFNKINTYQWFKANTYYLDEKHDPMNRELAFKKALEMDKLALGVFYINPKKTFEENLPVYQENKETVLKRKIDLSVLNKVIEQKK